ncbi:MAG TPA: hypothetical protein VMA13_04075, partial [Candidatus Saccharimonadales bacterium]|nr:hypothetical protein [Candidatus Saccharimonadales bacterium]
SLIAKGEKLEISEVLPPSVPPESNGVDLVRTAFSSLDLSGSYDWTNLPPMMQMVAPGKALIGWQQPDVRGFDFTNSWDNVTAAAEASRSAREMLMQAAAYPAIDFQLDYDKWPDSSEMLMKYLPPLKRSAQSLAAAAMCDLHNGDSASATTNICTLLALVQGEHSDRTLIAQLVRIAMTAIAADASWELLQSTNVNDAELAKLQKNWERLEFIEPVENSLLMERAGAEVTIQKMRADAGEFRRYTTGMLGSSGSSGAGGSSGWLDGLEDFWEKMKFAYAASMWRSSWSYSDELRTLQSDQIVLETLRAVETNRVFNPAYTNMLNRLAVIGITNEPDNWLLSKLDVPDYRRLFSEFSDSMSVVVRKTMAAEASKRIVITAIALKRYQLKHGNYPADLNSLVPEFLPAVPLDPVDGQPLRYRPNADGTFLLYSIGDDGVDDGGVPGKSQNFYWLGVAGPDWVWPQPATESEIQAY